MTLKDAAGNEIKKVAADFNVTLPVFSDIFLKRTSWDNEIKRTTNTERKITVTQGDLYYTTTDKNYSSLQVAELKLVMTNVDETKTTVDEPNTTITLGEDIISKEGKVLKSIKAKYEYEIMGEKLSSPEFTITPYSKADGVSFVWYGKDFSATPKDVIEWTYNSNINSDAQEIADQVYEAGSGDNKNKFKGLAAVIGSNKYDLNDDLSGVTYTAEITNPGYKNVKVKITNGKLTFKNKSGQEIITSPEGTYYDLQVKIIAKEGVIKNDGIVTVRVKILACL